MRFIGIKLDGKVLCSDDLVIIIWNLGTFTGVVQVHSPIHRNVASCYTTSQFFDIVCSPSPPTALQEKNLDEHYFLESTGGR